MTKDRQPDREDCSRPARCSSRRRSWAERTQYPHVHTLKDGLLQPAALALIFAALYEMLLGGAVAGHVEHCTAHVSLVDIEHICPL